jgi:hypothetical protein
VRLDRDLAEGELRGVAQPAGQQPQHLELSGRCLAGLVIAAAGAMLPATWAAGSRTASALRAE